MSQPTSVGATLSAVSGWRATSFSPYTWLSLRRAPPRRLSSQRGKSPTWRYRRCGSSPASPPSMSLNHSIRVAPQLVGSASRSCGLAPPLLDYNINTLFFLAIRPDYAVGTSTRASCHPHDRELSRNGRVLPRTADSKQRVKRGYFGLSSSKPDHSCFCSFSGTCNFSRGVPRFKSLLHLINIVFELVFHIDLLNLQVAMNRPIDCSHNNVDSTNLRTAIQNAKRSLI